MSKRSEKNLSSTVVVARELEVVNVATSQLQAYAGNARTHSQRQVQQIANSIKSFGFNNPVLVDENLRIVAGHGRVRAAELLGMREVPTIQLGHLTDAQLRAYVIADNRLAELAGWDRSILKIELQNLITVEEPDFEIIDTGFEIGEIDILLQEDEQPQEDEFVEEPESGPHIAQAGDVWCLGPHRIVCGSSLDPSTYTALLDGRKADMVFTDPPYNVKIDGHVSGNGRAKHREFAMASGEMSEEAFRCFLADALGLFAQNTREGSVHYVCMDWRHMRELAAAGSEIYEALLNVGVWVKDRAGMGSFYRSQHEMVFVFRNRGGTHQNNVQLGRYGRSRSNVWQYPSAKTLSDQGSEDLLKLHPTVKPIGLVADAIYDCCSRGDLVLDGFLGSGTTLLAAERTHRVCCGIELDPLYVDTAIRRWQKMTGKSATRAVSGESFAEREVAAWESWDGEEVLHEKQ